MPAIYLRVSSGLPSITFTCITIAWVCCPGKKRTWQHCCSRVSDLINDLVWPKGRLTRTLADGHAGSNGCGSSKSDRAIEHPQAQAHRLCLFLHDDLSAVVI